MHRSTVNYRSGNTQLRGFLCYDDSSKAKRPAVIVAHAWRGQDDFARRKAEDLAKMGYVALAADVYGISQPAQSDDEAAALMMPLFLNRQELQDRIGAAFQLMLHHPLVDPLYMGAIGFCFGGLTVIELLRSGAGVKAAVSFHGILGNEIQNQRAALVPMAQEIRGSLLVLHGHDDPLVSDSDIKALEVEMTQAKVDWTLIIYGHTSHAFTNPAANDVKAGLLYNAVMAKRSWLAMQQFFQEAFHGACVVPSKH